jgi:hypothetical protein
MAHFARQHFMLAQQLQDESIRQRPATYVFDELAKLAPVSNRHARISVMNGQINLMNTKLIAVRLSNFSRRPHCKSKQPRHGESCCVIQNNMWRELFAAMQQIALFGMREMMSAMYYPIKIRE